MKRLDIALVEFGLAPTRNKAQQLIEAGEVEVQVRGEWQTATHASAQIAQKADLRLTNQSQILKYVSRGGLKLEGALNHLKLDVEGWRCLDLGISTGGFSDCLLQRGAAAVCGLDVGHGQLHPQMQADARVVSFEGLNLKDVASHSGVQKWLSSGVDLCVVDLSFISLISLIPLVATLLPSGTRFLGLVKPQFEVGAANLDKKGIVRDANLFDDVQRRVLNALEQYGFSTELSPAPYFPSQVRGQDGNQEFFVYSLRT